MALGLWRLKETSKLVFNLCSGAEKYQLSKGGANLLHLHLKSSCCVCTRVNNVLECRTLIGRRYSTVRKKLHKPLPQVDFLSFVHSALDEHEGPSHRWLNKSEGSRCLFKKDRVFLILTGQFIGDPSVSGCNWVSMFEKVKSLQQRYPSLQVMGFQYIQSIPSNAVCIHLIWRIMTEYITFPILLSNKYFSEMKDGACCIMSNGLQSPLRYHEKDVDLATLDRAVKDLAVDHSENPKAVDQLESAWATPIRAVKEPYHTSLLRNLLLYFPGCISVDEVGNRLFLSDINHHRIIIFDCNGKILDSIGSSPGFEDAEFENAKLMRPAGSVYHATEDCLYFVDSENHAIRRADMRRRVVETLYPTNNIRKNASLWSWILDKLWKKRDANIKSEEFHSGSFLFPWHLMKSTNNDLFVLSRSFENLWIMDSASGAMREVVKGFPKILEICGQMIMEKSFLLKHMPNDWLQQRTNATCSLNGIPHAGLMSSVAKFKDHVVICDAVGQMVLKLDTVSGSISSFQLSNFGILGLPYWFSFPLERVYAFNDVLSEMHIDHTECFRLLPGRVDITLNVDIPEDIDLVEPLKENSVWRQARGAAIVVSGAESRADSSEKVGVSQQWYDEIDNLTFATSEIESRAEMESTSFDNEVQEGGVCINCTVSTSPGISEVIIYAPLYLRLKRSTVLNSDSQAKSAARLLDILNPIRMPCRDSLVEFMVTSKMDLQELIFIKLLHLRLRFECGNHPKADNTKNIILTDSSIEVNVAF